MTKERAKIKAEKYLVWADAAEKKSKEIYAAFNAEFKDFDWTQPILRGHHSQRRHEKVYERKNAMFQKMHDLDEKVKSHRSKAANLIEFANRNKGDAARKRQGEREKITAGILIGSEVKSVFFGICTVTKINSKTVRIKTPNGFEVLQDKSFLTLTK